ncbi:SCO family protein [Vogesella sp. LIG4]|uniref:SCO family protein n=1 Tax=Vogesella sp. LIG4 TaxID=1192162 RepID=UPI00081F9524|nr:SCO family protein [Vogesella sp. LIG4]SCK13959.1 protein SCO1/2 [Vogesella sp. LIG4]
MSRLLTWLAALLLAVTLAACSPGEKLTFKGTDLTGADFGKPFTLTGQDGKPHSLADYKGKAVVLFFGYTHCPDVCPTTMLEYQQVMKQLGKDADQVQVLFISVDPERDTPQVLAGYLPFFDKRFMGLTGEPELVKSVAAQYKVVAQKQPTAGGGYSVDHSAGSYVFDRNGQLRVYMPYNTPVADIAHDLQQLLR